MNGVTVDMTNAADEPGHGRYDLLAKLGEGPRGPRFVARRAGSVAADPWFELELSAFATGEDEPLHGFVRDIERATRLAHRNVLGIVDLGTSPAGRFIVTEHVDDGTLSELQARDLLPDLATQRPRLVLAAVIDALHGLHAAHTLTIDGVAQPLVHGGIAPDRLRIGLDGVCRVAGFGHARPRVHTRASHRTLSAAGYMAPEQLTSAEFDHRADLFAIGIVLWNALTGKKLFHDRIEHLTMSNVLERRVPRPSLVGLSPPPALDAAVVKALERNPERRYQTAAEMAAALRDVARGAGCLAPPAEVSEWVTATFGGELAVRHRTIRQLAGQPRSPDTEIPTLAPLGGPAPAATAAREELSEVLSLEELARAVTGVRPATATPAPPAARAARAPAPARKQLAILAIAAFAVVAVVLGWRTSHADDDVAAAEPAAAPAASPAPPPPRLALEITVLDVHRIAPVPPAPAAAPVPPEPAAPLVRAPPDPTPAPAPPRVTATRTPEPARSAPPPARPAARIKKPAESPPPRPAEPRAEPPPPPAAPSPAKPEPARQTMDANPYIYK